MIILLGGLVVSREWNDECELWYLATTFLLVVCAFSVAPCAHILPYLRYPPFMYTELGINASGTLCSHSHYVLLSRQSLL
jgi:hypothetical protein